MADDTYDVFVSYSRADGRHAKEIDSVLPDKGLKTVAALRRERANLYASEQLGSTGRAAANVFAGLVQWLISKPLVHLG